MSETQLLAQSLARGALDSFSDPGSNSDDERSRRKPPAELHAKHQSDFEKDIATLTNVINTIKLQVDLLDPHPFAGGFTAVGSTPVAEGSYFQVHKLSRTEDEIAAKYPRQKFLDAEGSVSSFVDLEAIRSEIEALTHPPLLRHENIVRVLGLSWARLGAESYLSLPILYLEFAPHGNLLQYLTDNKTSSRERLSLGLSVANGLHAVHSCSIMHGDLKLENILIFQGQSGEVVAKLSDFGCSTKLVDGASQLRGATQPWNAPEWRDIIRPEYMHAVDIYSLGLLLWRLCLEGHNPFGTMQMDDIEFRKARGLIDQDASHSVREYYDFFRDTHLLACTEAEIYDEYLRMVLLPCKAFKASLSLRPERRSLQGVREAFSERVVFGLETPGKASIQKDMVYSRGRAANRYQPFYSTPVYVRKMHLKHLEMDTDNSDRSPWAAGDLCLQLAFANIDGFTGYQNFCAAKHWLVQACQMGHLPAQEIVYRMLVVCNAVDQRGEAVYREQLIAWLERAAATGSNIALEDLRRIAPHAAKRNTRIWKDMPTISRMVEPYRKLERSNIFTKGNVTGLARQAHEIGGSEGLACFRLDEVHNTLLHYAAVFCSSLEDFEFITSLFDDVSIANKAGNTSLHLAMLAGNAKHARVLLLHGADPNVRNSQGGLAYHNIIYLPRNTETNELLNLLISRNADMTASSSGYRPDVEYRYIEKKGNLLDLAVMENRLDLARILLANGVDPVHHSGVWSPLIRSIALCRWRFLLEFLPYLKSKEIVLGEGLGEGADKAGLVMRKDLASFASATGPTHDRIILHGQHYKYAFTQTIRILHESNLLPEDLSNAIYYSTCVSQVDKVDTLLKFHAGYPQTRSTALTSAFKKSIGQIYPSIALWMLHQIDGTMLQVAMRDSGLLHEYICSASPCPLVLEVLLRIADTSNIEKTDGEGRTLFALAVECRKYELATHLLSRGVDANTLMGNRTLYKWSRPTVNIVYNLIALVRDLDIYPLRYLLEPLHPFKENLPDFIVQPELGFTALHAAAKWGNSTVFDYVLAKYHEPKHLSAQHTPSGWTALHFAAHFGNLHAVRLLCDYATPLSVPSSAESSFSTALDLSRSVSRLSGSVPRTEEYWEQFLVRRFQIWELLKSKGACYSKMRPPVHCRFLKKALRQGWSDLMAEVLQSLENTNDYKVYLVASLHRAARAGHSHLVQRLLSLGAAASDRSPSLRTPLHTAVQCKNLHVVRVLVQAHADLTARDYKGRTPAMLAFCNDDLGLREFLLASGSSSEMPTFEDVLFDVELDAEEQPTEQIVARVYRLTWNELHNDEWETKSSFWLGEQSAAHPGIIEELMMRNRQDQDAAEELQRRRINARKFRNVWKAARESEADMQSDTDSISSLESSNSSH